MYQRRRVIDSESAAEGVGRRERKGPSTRAGGRKRPRSLCRLAEEAKQVSEEERVYGRDARKVEGPLSRREEVGKFSDGRRRGGKEGEPGQAHSGRGSPSPVLEHLWTRTWFLEGEDFVLIRWK